MDAVEMGDVKRLVSHNVIEPKTLELFKSGGKAGDSKIANLRAAALEIIGIRVGPSNHNWGMVDGKLEFVTTLP